jgi:hypothetical protein
VGVGEEFLKGFVPFHKEKETRHYKILGKPADALFPTEMTTVTLSQLMSTIALSQFNYFLHQWVTLVMQN